MSRGPLCPNLTQKHPGGSVKMATWNLPHMILQVGLSVNLSHQQENQINLNLTY